MYVPRASNSEIKNIWDPQNWWPIWFFNSYWFEFLDQCRILAFPSTLFFVGERLVNHTIANISVIDRDTCEYRCYLDHNCVSVNFYFGENGVEAHNCELNNSTGKEYDKDLVKAANYVYHGTKVPVVKFQLHYILLQQFMRAKGALFIFMSEKRLLSIICYFYTISDTWRIFCR